ncbi:MAG: ABC transporter permease [Gemmataceae bacterium]
MGEYRARPLTIVIATLIAAFLFAPLLAVVPISLTPADYLSMPSGALSFTHYETIWTDPSWIDSIAISLKVGLVSSIMATSLAVCFALGLWYTRTRFSRYLIGFVALPMVVPPVVSAIVLYFLMTSLPRALNPVGYDTWPGVVVAHVVMNTPFAMVVVLSALGRLDRSIERAARSVGASLWRTTVIVVLPNIKFGIAGAAVLAFMLSWQEVTVTLFVTSVNAITLPVRIWMGLRDNVDPAAAAISVVLVVITACTLLIRMLVIRMQVRKLHAEEWHAA